MLIRIHRLLSDFKEQLGIDRDLISNTRLSSRKELATNWLLGFYAKGGLAAAFEGPDKVKNLQEESTHVIPYIEGELRETLRSIIEYIEILYGIRADLSSLLIANKDPAARWVDMSNKTLTKIESAQGSIKSLVQSQGSESVERKGNTVSGASSYMSVKKLEEVQQKRVLASQCENSISTYGCMIFISEAVALFIVTSGKVWHVPSGMAIEHYNIISSTKTMVNGIEAKVCRLVGITNC